MLIRIDGATTTECGDSLCDTCRHSRIIRGRRLDEEIVFCNMLYTRPIRITFKVTGCSDYTDRRGPSYVELMEKAWILRPATKRRAAGFIRAADLPPDDPMRLGIDPMEPD